MPRLLRRLVALAVALALLMLAPWPDVRFNVPLLAAVAFDAFANADCESDGGPLCTTGNTILTYAITVGSGSNRQIGVLTFVGCGGADSAPAVSSVTYAGTTLTEIVAVNPAASRRGYLHAWPTGSQPTSGANNVVVTLASSLTTACNASNGNLLSGAIAATGVDQSTTFTSSGSNSGTGTSATLTLSSSGANDLGISSVCAGGGITSTTETVRWDVDDTVNSCASHGGATAAGADTSFSWTIPSDSWVTVGAAFKEASGAAVTPKLLLLGVGEGM